MFPAFLFAVQAYLLADTRIRLDIPGIGRQEIGECAANSLHFMHFTGTVCQLHITFPEGRETVGYAALTFINAVVGCREQIRVLRVVCLL